MQAKQLQKFSHSSPQTPQNPNTTPHTPPSFSFLTLLPRIHIVQLHDNINVIKITEMHKTQCIQNYRMSNIKADKLIKACGLIVMRDIPKLNPYVAIKALLTIMIPTEVTTLNIHAAASTVAFLSALFAGDIFICCFQLNTSFYCPVFTKACTMPGCQKPIV